MSILILPVFDGANAGSLRALLRLSLFKGEGRVWVSFHTLPTQNPLTLILSPLRKGRGGMFYRRRNASRPVREI